MHQKFKSTDWYWGEKAEAIVQYREKHGNFTVAEQLLEVQGIGKATLEKKPRSYRVLMLLFYMKSGIVIFRFFIPDRKFTKLAKYQIFF